MTDKSSHEDLRRSHNLRLNRVRKAREELDAAKAELHVLFKQTFVHPDIAAAKFAKLVEKRGLIRAAKAMRSDPTKPALSWRALRGKVHPFSGLSREREYAVEQLKRLAAVYREAEEAQRTFELAQTLVDETQQALVRKLDHAPKLEPQITGQRQRRRLRQTQ